MTRRVHRWAVATTVASALSSPVSVLAVMHVIIRVCMTACNGRDEDCARASERYGEQSSGTLEGGNLTTKLNARCKMPNH
ncbi:MAG: hypothetical protein QOD90_1483 [Mycobacterium sp.]|nr:hypothetical protein [Mycobacterium sp.]